MIKNRLIRQIVSGKNAKFFKFSQEKKNHEINQPIGEKNRLFCQRIAKLNSQFRPSVEKNIVNLVNQPWEKITNFFK